MDPNRYSALQSKKKIEKYKHRREVTFKQAFESGRLSLEQFELLYHADQTAYLDKMVRIKYKGVNRNRFIGGYYQCFYCAKADIFNTGGHITEDENDTRDMSQWYNVHNPYTYNPPVETDSS